MRCTGWIMAAALLAGCTGKTAPDTRPLQNDVQGPIAVTVNGLAVPQALLEAVARARGLDLTQPDQRGQALNLLTDYVLLAQSARENGFFSDSSFRAAVEAARLQAVGNATLERLQQQAPITDAVVRAEYDSEVGRAGKFEYDFSQLLFDNAGDAAKAEAEIAGGKPFSAVYEEWRAHARQAKVFTRARQDQLPEELAAALAGMKNGETTRTALKTQYGWHVVHLDIVNPFAPPPFEQMKDAVRRTLLLDIGRERLRKLKEQAKIEYPPGAAPPAAAKAASDDEAAKVIGGAKGG